MPCPPSLVENAKFKLVYKLQDPDTALWVAKMSGTILVDDESRKAKTNRVLTEVIDDERTIRQAERFYIDSNMLLNLPPFVSYIFTATELPRASLISPLKVKKQPLQVYDVTPITPISIKKPLDFTEAPATQTAPVLVAAEKKKNRTAELAPVEPVVETSSFDFDE